MSRVTGIAQPHSYALFNYRLKDPALGLKYSNLRLIRAFEHGLDPNSSEAGFVLVHVDMVKHSGELVDGAVTALEGCSSGNREQFDTGMEGLVSALGKVNQVMDGQCLALRRHKFRKGDLETDKLTIRHVEKIQTK
jgi:hypothetical protein